MMETKKCPNCLGELQKQRNKWVCPYCNSSFDAEEETKKQGSGYFDSDLFSVDLDFESLMSKKNTVECLKSWKYCMDEMDSAEMIEDYLSKITQKDDGTAMANVRSERIDALRGRFDQYLESGERIYILVDTTLFGKGKEFYIITDRACRFFTKKKQWSVNFDDIVSVTINDSLNLPCFYLNNDYEKSVSSAGNSYQTAGAMFALITRLAFERNPERARIRLVK